MTTDKEQKNNYALFKVVTGNILDVVADSITFNFDIQ